MFLNNSIIVTSALNLTVDQCGGIRVPACRLVRFDIQSELQCTEFTDFNRPLCVRIRAE